MSVEQLCIDLAIIANIIIRSLIIRLVVFAAFWAETSLHNGLFNQVMPIGTFIENFTDYSTSTSSVLDDIVLLVEDRR